MRYYYKKYIINDKFDMNRDIVIEAGFCYMWWYNLLYLINKKEIDTGFNKSYSRYELFKYKRFLFKISIKTVFQLSTDSRNWQHISQTAKAPCIILLVYYHIYSQWQKYYTWLCHYIIWIVVIISIKGTLIIKCLLTI